jgi:hypothetical protein
VQYRRWNRRLRGFWGTQLVIYSCLLELINRIGFSWNNRHVEIKQCSQYGKRAIFGTYAALSADVMAQMWDNSFNKSSCTCSTEERVGSAPNTFNAPNFGGFFQSLEFSECFVDRPQRIVLRRVCWSWPKPSPTEVRWKLKCNTRKWIESRNNKGISIVGNGNWTDLSNASSLYVCMYWTCVLQNLVLCGHNSMLVRKHDSTN